MVDTHLYSPSAERHRTLDFGWYSFSVPLRIDGWVGLSGWSQTEVVYQTVTHPSTNRARCRVTSLIETNALPLSQTATVCVWISDFVQNYCFCAGSLKVCGISDYIYCVTPWRGRGFTIVFLSIALDFHAYIHVVVMIGIFVADRVISFFLLRLVLSSACCKAVKICW